MNLALSVKDRPKNEKIALKNIIFKKSNSKQRNVTCEYLMSVASEDNKNEIFKKIRQDLGEHKMTTIAESWVEEGRIEGFEKGIEKGSEEKGIDVAKKLIGMMSLEKISEVSGLSLEKVKELAKEA